MSQLSKFAEQFPLALLSILTLKMTFFGTSLPEMGSFLGVASVVGIATYMQRNKRIDDFSAIVSKQNEVIHTMSVELAKVKTAMEGIKLTSGFKKVG